jgi:diguanylate cyclase (GGDEF)-like protein/PAS domain S-box-containing protein
MSAPHSSWKSVFHSPWVAWAVALVLAVGVPLTWQWLQLPANLSAWVGAYGQWFSLPWMVVVAGAAAIVWLQQMDMGHRKPMADAIYSAAYRTLPDAAGITSLKDGRFIDVNPAFCSMLGLQHADVIGRTNAELQVYATPYERTKLLDELSVTGQVDRMRILCQSHGELVPGTISAVLIEVACEPCMLFVFHDMREHDKAVQELHAVNHQLQQAGHLAKLGAWEDRRGAGMVYWSEVCYDIHGLPRGSTPPKDYLHTFVAPESRTRMRAALQHCLRDHHNWEIEIQIVRTDGRKIWVRSRGEAVINAEGKIIAMRGVMQDIDEYKQQENAMREREALLAVTLEAAALGRWDWDLHTGTITGEQFWRNLNGLPTTTGPSSLGQSREAWHWAELMDEADVTRCNIEIIRHVEHPQDGPFDITWRSRSHTSADRWLRAIGKVISTDVHGRALRLLGVCLDVTAQQAQKNNLQQLAHFDALTGLANRVELGIRLEDSLRLNRQSVQLMAVVYLDLDGFKSINDRLGHAAGDRLLVVVAKRLQHAMRANDCVARFGGDEFVLLINQLNSRSECEASLQRIMVSISRPYSLDGSHVRVTASIGYTLYPDDDADADTLIRHADQAMYQAKQAGRNRIHGFDALLDRNLRARHTQSLRIQEALERDEFTLYVQPKIDMCLHQVVGVEALARWKHQEHGLLTPKDFLHQIEGTELEIPFGQWAVSSAMQTIEKFQQVGLRMPVAVNVSPRHLQHPGFTAWIRELLLAHPHISAALLDLEITESATLYDLAYITHVLKELRALGLTVSLDDFGTGYSSLTSLRSLPLDCLKIDRSFMQDMLTDATDLAVVHGVVNLAQSFGYKVLAEGVENEAQCATLERMGCHLAQGYYFAQAMHPDHFHSWLSSWKPQAHTAPHGALSGNSGASGPA